MGQQEEHSSCNKSRCGCGPEPLSIGRRGFLAITGMGAVSATLPDWPAVAGPFEGSDFEQLVPRDKKLNPDWVGRLTEPGQPETYRGPELSWIGMPVGGIACGQLYLGGDGRLWYWDIFTSTTTTDYDSKIWAGPHYEHPLQPRPIVDQGFAIRVKQAEATTTRPLDSRGFKDITFRGEYPIGRVTYRDEALPVSVSLEAFSPFVPLNVQDSSLPATVLAFEVKNTGGSSIEISLAGWLENAVCRQGDRGLRLLRRNSVETGARNGVSLVGTVVQADGKAPVSPDKVPGYGSMALTLLGKDQGKLGVTDDVTGDRRTAPEPGLVFDALKPAASSVSKPLDQHLVGALGRTMTLLPGQSVSFTFILTWWFPYYGQPKREMAAITQMPNLKRHYIRRFDGALAVAEYVADHFDRLTEQTRLWNRTWYDSTLPRWFLDRTLTPVNCLATQAFHAFDNGRYWGWEGVDCCPGTCQHVWQYAQSVSRLFPAIERDLRERVDFGLAWHESGSMDFRAENDRHVAHDGFCGTIVRAYREHQMAGDSEFLKRIWPRVRRSLEFIMSQDRDADGLLEGEQMNTLDTAWFGPMAWISSLYLAAVSAGAAMADEMGDVPFAARCRKLVETGGKSLVATLYNGEYFIHKPPDYSRNNTNIGCHSDQMLGQSMALQVGLKRFIPEAEARRALRSLWRYNFTPDVGPYREKFKTIPGGRWYAMPGEGGLLVTTFPHGGAERATGKNSAFAFYFNECWTGFEYQVASQMLWEGMVTEALAIVRMIHDRYHPARRNPYNEVECSDHYARAMSSHGVFLAACGFEYHGPAGHLGFAPRLTPHDFRAPFTTAEGWGTISQKRDQDHQLQRVEVRWGSLRLRTLAFEVPEGVHVGRVNVVSAGQPVHATHKQVVKRIAINLDREARLAVGQAIEVEIS
jgi:uncharacterized protein (DUF608 family)